MAGIGVHAQEQRVALRRARVRRQRVLQRGQKLVAVQRHHAVVVVRCRRHARQHPGARPALPGGLL